MSAKGKFSGVVTWKDGEAAAQLGDAVKTMLKRGVSVYNDGYQDPQAPEQLQRAVDSVVNLSDHFLLNSRVITCRTSIANQLHLMKVEQATLRRILLVDYQEYEPWTLQQSDQIGSALDVIFGCLRELMNIHDLERIQAIVNQAKVCLRATKALVSEQSKHLSAPIEDFSVNCEFLCQVLDLRVPVMKDGDLKSRLKRANALIKSKIEPLISSCKAARKDKTDEKLAAISSNAKVLATALQSCIEIVSFGFVIESDYEKKAFDDKGFNNNIDALLSSIDSGNVEAAADEATELCGKLRLTKGDDLEEARGRLQQQTAELLNASKKALEEKDSQDAKSLLASLVRGLKTEAASYAKQEQAHLRRQKRLLQGAGALGQAIDHMEENAGGNASPGPEHKRTLPAFATIQDLNGLVADMRLTLAQ